MLIKEIEPIEDCGVNLLEKDNPDEIIDKIVELPLRKACKLLRQKGIETVMSSANKNNILKTGEKRKEKEDMIKEEMIELHSSLKNTTEGWSLSTGPNIEDAGCGYAWIMLNFDTLSDENKDLLFNLEERVDNDGNKIGEKGVWFVHPFRMGKIDYQLRSGQLEFEDIKCLLNDDEIKSLGKIKKDDRLEKFEKKSIILGYNTLKGYSTQTVMIRMPINEDSTVEEVEEYFCQFAKSLRQQNREKEMEEEVLE